MTLLSGCLCGAPSVPFRAVFVGCSELFLWDAQCSIPGCLCGVPVFRSVLSLDRVTAHEAMTKVATEMMASGHQNAFWPSGIALSQCAPSQIASHCGWNPCCSPHQLASQTVNRRENPCTPSAGCKSVFTRPQVE